MTVGVVIPTLNAQNEIGELLRIIFSEVVVDDVIVVDSSSVDRTREIAHALGARVLKIERREFNHGTTRELGRKTIGTDVVVYVTQDIVPRSGFILKLVTPLVTGIAEVAYSRQIPRDGAGMLEAFPRLFNYPESSEVRSIKDVEKKGVFTFFCSDSSSAYLSNTLDEVGGFEHVLTNEDYIAVAKIVINGGRIAYVAESIVQHSHHYTLWQEFTRYFDNGYIRGVNTWITKIVGNAENHGGIFVLHMLRELWLVDRSLLPRALVQTMVKWLGFRLGVCGRYFPRSVCRLVSMNRYYW